MHLWTYQPKAVLDTLESVGVVGVDPAFYEDGGPVAYRWLASRLHRVIPGYSGRFPWWLYTRCPWPEGRREGEWMLELEIPAELCFEMPIWAWNDVFRGVYLALDRFEFERWQRRCRRSGLQDPPGHWEAPGEPQPAILVDEVMASFDRLFEGNLPKYAPYYPRGWRFGRKNRPSRRGHRRPATEVVTEWLRREWLIGKRGPN